MSYLNINYSTLEDAWGSNFEKANRKKQSNVCNLYNNGRKARVEKPYKTIRESAHIKPIYDEENYVKYHGYKDGNPYSRKHNKLSKYNLEFPYKKRQVPIKSNVYVSDEEQEDYYLIEEEIEDYYESTKPKVKPQKFKKSPPLIRTNFSYIDEEDQNDTSNQPIVPKRRTKKPIVIEEEDENDYILKKQVHSSFRNKPKRTIRRPFVQPEDDYPPEDIVAGISHSLDEEEEPEDDEFESYFKNPMEEQEQDDDDNEEDEAQYASVLRSIYEESINDAVSASWKNKSKKRSTEEEEEFVMPTRKKQQERIFLDLILYTISGIILIFIMEQFIQIGMKIKTPI
jgi:hypothetical protein